MLISLIESVQEEHLNSTERDSGYESGDDDEVVLRSMKLVGSTAGTYVVKVKEGLKVHPTQSRKQKVFCRIGGISEEPKDVKILRYGQEVQISRFENGMATVARGAGHIYVDTSSQLVKGNVQHASRLL